MVIEVKMEGKIKTHMVKCGISSGNNGVGESRVDVSKVEKRCRKVEEKLLSFQIRNKDVELEEIRENKIRVLEGERVRVEEEVKGLRIAKAGFDGLDEGNVDRQSEKVRIEEGSMGLRKEMTGVDGSRISEAMVSGLVLVEGNVDRESGEESKTRVLDGKRVGIEERVKGLRKEMEGLDGSEISEVVVDEGNVDKENVEVTKIDRLLIENKVLEREKGVALKEVEEWKRKCEEFECRVRELEERLSCQGKDVMFTEVEKDTKNVNVGGSTDFGFATCSRIEGTSSMENELKKHLACCDGRNCDQKIDPSPSPGARPSSLAVIGIDSDCELDVPAEHGHDKSGVSPSVMPGVGVSETDSITNEEDEINGEGNDPLSKTLKRKRDLTVVTSDDELEENKAILKRRAFKIGVGVSETGSITDDEENEISGEENDPLGQTPKRKRDLTLVTSDDELEEHEVMPKRRGLKIHNSDNESDEEEDDDDALPIKQIFNKVNSNCQSDDEDNIPISQLIKIRAQGSRSDDCHNLNRPRRRLVKRGQSAQSDRTPERKNSLDDPTMKYVEDEKSGDSGSDTSLSGFIVSDDTEDSNHHSDEAEEASDDNLCFKDIISSFQSRKDPNSEWGLLADMLSDFGKNFELCMRGVCAIYRRQIAKEKLWYEDYCHTGVTGQGFNKFDAPRGTTLGDFLTDGDPNGGVVKTVEELEIYDPEGPEVCRTLAGRYSNQLFEIYHNGEDQFFP